MEATKQIGQLKQNMMMGRIPVVVMGSGMSAGVGAPTMGAIHRYLESQIKNCQPSDTISVIKDLLAVLDAEPQSPRSVQVRLYHLLQTSSEKDIRKIWSDFGIDLMTGVVASHGIKLDTDTLKPLWSLKPSAAHLWAARLGVLNRAILVSLNYDGLTKRAVESVAPILMTAPPSKGIKTARILSSATEINTFFTGNEFDDVVVDSKNAGFDGHVMEENGKMVVEYDNATGSGRRRRFTIAHEVGHLALWEVTSNKRKLPARRSAAGSEIEQLCNKIAAEILAPLDEVTKLNVFSAREGLSKAELILKLTEHFDISLNFAALRFKEVSKRHIGVGLLSVPEKRFEWCHGIASRFMLLNRLIVALPSRQAVGASSYSIDSSTGISMIPFEWKSLSDGRYLIVTSG